ncbi:alcohol dehydrogenase [Kitasatospora sp. NPDC101801]|uniref:alcohol dehydrogenase n=1 Tax=Kitasatospora sp. NPDC101801 TaxID=3364103 RepID=UPI0037FE81A6
MTEIQTHPQDQSVAQAEDEIVIAVRAIAPEHAETIKAEPLPEGWLTGWDVAGVVMRAAPEGFGPKPGDRVVGVATGTEWAPCMALSTEYAVVLPDHVSFEQAAALRVAVLTALRLVRSAGTMAGRRVLVTGAEQGIGRLLVELAATLRAEVTGIVGRASEAGQVAELGATHVVCDAAEAEGAFDVVYDAVAGSTAGAGLVADGGVVFLYESFAANGADTSFFRFFGGPAQAGLRHFVFRTATPEDRELAQLLDLLTVGELSFGGVGATVQPA